MWLMTVRITGGLSLSLQQQSFKHMNMYSVEADGNEVMGEI